MVDFLITKYEMYIKMRLTEFANGRYTKAQLFKMLPKEFDKGATFVQQGSDEGCFKVICNDKAYDVDIIRGICSCSSGLSGILCQHFSVLVNFEECSTSYNVANTETKKIMLYVAEGREVKND